MCINVNTNKHLERLSNESGNVLVTGNVFTSWLEDVGVKERRSKGLVIYLFVALRSQRDVKSFTVSRNRAGGGSFSLL